MKDQVGGHPMWKHGSNYLLKPLKCDDRGMREVAFYEMSQEAVNYVCQKNHSSPSKTYYLNVRVATQGMDRVSHLLRALKPFIPEYFGVVEHHGNLFHRFASDSKIVLADITAMYTQKCVLDLKMGRQTFEPNASIEKKESQRKKYPEQHEFGFRIVGMRVYDPSHEESDQCGYRTFDKGFGRRLKKREEVGGALSTFFNVRGCDPRKEMVGKILDRIKTLRQLLEEYNKEMAFYASSILIAFEGDGRILSPDMFSIKLIDFAHVRYQAGGDPGFNHGLDTIIALIEGLVRE